ncbi:MAG: serine/threonine-protein kinase [Streptosporangiaceae bacterium]|jgi:serine/threonine protein kinase
MKALGTDDPRMIGGYRLRGRLGTGGMGRVYLGLSPGGRAVAIKVVHPDLARDSEFLRRFGQEVAAARAVSGIYTAPVVASGLEEHPPWLATAFVPGPSLDQVVSEHGPMPEPALWPLLAGLIEALQAIHACGVVHRDLKPANVLLAADGPRVIDFGISRAADGTALTVAGTVFGTPGYMSPEQAEGKAAGPASDVFALGCVIAYAATGTGPFGSGTAAAVLYRVVYGEPALDGIPPQLREAVTACLAKDPGARPTLPALAATIAHGMYATGPSAVAFWPRSVTGLIGAYQARLEQETRTGDAAAAEGQEFPRATPEHPQTMPSNPGNGPQRPPQPPGQPGSQPVAQSYPHPRGYTSTQAQQAQQGPQGPWTPLTSQAPRNSQAWQASQASQALPPAPRGYLPTDGRSPASAAPASFPPPYELGSRGPITPMPGTMVTAVRLMYAGAAFALVYAIGFVAVVSGIIKNHPTGTLARDGLAAIAVPVILVSLVEIALWLWVARGCRNRRNGARVTGTVLFGIHTLGALGVLASHSNIGLARLLTVVSWLIACSAVVFLWRRPSSAFFAASNPMNRTSVRR